jgi:hypothetical protein
MVRTRVIVVICLLVVVTGLGVLVGYVFPRLMGRGPAPKILNTATILQQVQTLSQLVTVKYVLEKVVILDDVKWYGESRVLMLAHGIVKAGVDLSQVKSGDIHVLGEDKVVITLPRAQITDSYLDDKRTQVIERKTGLLRSFDVQLEQTARQQAVDDIRRAARNNGIQDDANERARLQLTSFFHQLGFQQVEFRNP